MSCCIIKKDTTSSVEELNKLRKYFDEVVLEDKETYRLLTLRDKANKSNYDYVVWLSIKVSYGFSNERTYSAKTDDEMLSNVCKSILDWIDILKNFEKSDVGKQLSLFEEEDENEPEPEPPTPSSDGNWSAYFKKRNEVRKRNLMKKYSFFELLSTDYYTYSGIDYRTMLPSIDEVRELTKKAILKGKDNPGRYDEFWCDTPSYLTRDGALSDYELMKRLHFGIRLFLLPYKSYFHVWTDDSYSAHTHEECIEYRYYLDGENLSTCSSHDNDKLDLPSYDNLYNLKFLDWVRNTLDIPHKNVISDDEILKENLKSWFRYDDFEKDVNTAKDWKQFKAVASKKVQSNGGGSGYSLDGFDANHYYDRKGEIKISQPCEHRIELNRNIDNLEIDEYKGSESYIVSKINGDEIYKKAYDMFNKKEVANQVSLFDLLAA